MALKESRRSINEMLGQVREELEMVDNIGDLRKCERKLLEANVRTAIDGLEQLLERTRAQMRKLERVSDRTFEKIKKLKARAVKEADFERDCHKGDSSSSIVMMNKRWAMWWRWTKMMELLRPFRCPTCKIGDEVEVGLSEVIREVAAKLKVKIDNDGGDVIAEAMSRSKVKAFEDGGVEKKSGAKIKVGAKSNAMKMKAVR